MKSINTFLFLFTGLFILTLTGCAPGSGVALIEKSGSAFKDLKENGAAPSNLSDQQKKLLSKCLQP